ncbi:MAG: PAS domain-containing protein [Rhizobium sp.]|nr:PAS domain-containing protein [Rhizobium sp.]
MPTRKLLNAEKNLRRLESTLRAGFWTYDAVSDSIEWSTGLYSILGLNREAVLPDMELGRSLIHPDDQLEWSNVVAQARSLRQADRTIRIIRTDGQMIWVRSHFEGQFDRNGKLTSIFGVLVDISAQEIERDEASKDRAFVSSLRTLTQGAFWRAGPDGKLLDLADWTRRTGQSPGKARDWDALTPIHPDDREAFRQAWRTGISEGLAFGYQVRISDRAGKYATYRTRAVPVMDEAGKVTEWHGYSTPVEEASPVVAKALGSAQIRAARALLDWSGPELAARSGVSFSTIKRMEKSESLVKPESIGRARATLEAAGIRFAAGAEGDVWVSLAAGSTDR